MADEREKPASTWIQWLAASVIVGLVAAVILPAINNALKAARRTTCIGQLKQIGLAIQNFHDIREEICPSYLTDDSSSTALPRNYASWPVLLLPYMEQSEAYALLDLSRPLNDSANVAVRSISIPTFHCPARRRGDGLTRDGADAVGDYANVALADAVPGVLDYADPRTWDAAMLVCNSFPIGPQGENFAVGNTSTATRPTDFTAMTAFRDVVDGLSYTALLGEKAAHPSRLGRATDPGETAMASHQDGTIYYGGGGDPANLSQPGEMAYWSRRLAPRNATERLLPLKPRDEDPQNRFGSWHAGVTMFALGDGSVRAVSNATATVPLQRLGCRNDERQFDLP